MKIYILIYKLTCKIIFYFKSDIFWKQCYNDYICVKYLIIKYNYYFLIIIYV